MAQINFHTTPDFEGDLDRLMRDRGITSKSEAIRLAVHEAAANANAVPEYDSEAWRRFRGAANRLPDSLPSGKTGAELEAEIDREMDEKLERLSRRQWTKTK